MDLANLTPGDIVLREFSAAPMRLPYFGTRDGLIYAGFGLSLYWTFDVATGAEVDDGLSWGPVYGRTGSYLSAVERQDPKVDVDNVLKVWQELTAKLDQAKEG